jgi:hypothetical protein
MWEMEHIMKCANWKVRGQGHREEEEEDCVLGEKQFEITTIKEQKEGIQNYTEQIVTQ